MKKLLLAGTAALVGAGLAAQADAKIPLMSWACPGDISVFSESGGPIYVNGEEAKLQAGDGDRYVATTNGTTVTITFARDGSPLASYKTRVASGACRALPPPSDDNG